MALGLGLTPFLQSCDDKEKVDDKTPVIGVSLNKETLLLDLNGTKTETLTATVDPTNATVPTVKWTSSATGVATVADGVVTGLAAGDALIIVTTDEGGFADTCKVTVASIATHADGVSLNTAALTLIPGDTVRLIATVAPEEASVKKVIWTSNATDKATVSDAGLVTAVAQGTATITVTTLDGNKTATCAVTVGAEPVVRWELYDVDSTDHFHEGIWYRVVREGELAVVRDTVEQRYEGTVTVPSTIVRGAVTYTVKYVANRAFAFPSKEDAKLEYVNLPPTIISFGGCAFQYCASLKSIVIPNSTTALWDDNFDGVDDAEGATFMDCTGLEEITIGAGITNLTAPNGLFHPVPNLKKVTCLATNPPLIDTASTSVGWAAMNTGGSKENAVLFISPDANVNDFLIDYWWDFATAEQKPGNRAGGIYHVGECVQPWSLSATNDGKITWRGATSGYYVLVSPTELASPSGGQRVTTTEHDVAFDITPNVTNYVYVRSDCNNVWKSVSFFPPIENGCEYTVFGDMNGENNAEGYDENGWGWYNARLQVIQNGIVVIDITNPTEEDGTGTSITLLPNVPATFKWIGGDYADPAKGYSCWFRVKNADGDVLIEQTGLYGDQEFTPVSTCTK